MSGIIRAEQLTEFRRWQANAFDGSVAPAPAPGLPDPAPDIPAGNEDEAAPPPPQAGEPEAPPPPPPEPQVILPSEEELAAIREEARQAGYAIGLEEGRRDAATEIAKAKKTEADRVGALIRNLNGALAGMEQEVAEQVLDLALEVARQVIRGKLKANRACLLGMIREAMHAMPLHHGNVALHVNPADADFLRENLSELGASGGVHIAPDNTITAGGCLLKAGSSEVDATLETRWRRVLESIGLDPEPWQEM